MTNWWPELLQTFTDEYALPLLRAGLIIGFGLLFAKAISRGVWRLLKEKTTPHRTMLFRRGVYYAVLSLFFLSALQEFGFDMSVLLGTAGIVTVALGFASQTSASNLISGLFLIFEQPFAVGDVIRVGDTFGEVLAIDLLSTKIRPFDNTYVRIPNETIIKTPVTNFTRFAIRRIDLKLIVALKEDIEKVRTTLVEVADQNPLCLQEPQPLFIFLGYGESSLNIQFSVWVRREEFLTLQNGLYMEIKTAFDQQGIEIPYPHRTLYPGVATEPFPVTVVSEK